MKTKIISIHREDLNDCGLREAAAVLRRGGLVAFPTETVYGLGANALKEQAASKIYAAKGRPSDNPLIVHIAKESDLSPLVTEIPEAGRKLAQEYWPGPLTMIFNKSSVVPYATTGGLDTVAVRMPDDAVASRLIELAGVPIAAPSANASGRPSPTRAEHVLEDMDGRIELIVDGGPVGIGVESTIVDVTGKVPMLLRPGAVTLEMLQKTLGDVEIDPAMAAPMESGAKPKAPGMKYRHYAPRANLTLVEDAKWEKNAVSRNVVETIRSLAAENMRKGRRTGILCTDETKDSYPEKAVICSLGQRDKEETIAHSLFAALRELDSLEVEDIYSESFPGEHLGGAIMNRLTKAAGYHVRKV